MHIFYSWQTRPRFVVKTLWLFHIDSRSLVALSLLLPESLQWSPLEGVS